MKIVQKGWQRTHKYRGVRPFWQASGAYGPAGQAHLTILGIETSCDETGVALVRLSPNVHHAPGAPRAPNTPNPLPKGEILAQALHSQIAMHADYGGVVPELASRDHILRLVPLTEKVMAEAGLNWDAVDAIAFTEGPGLAGALLVGASTAQGLAESLGKPILGVHHLEGHLLSPLLDPAAAGLEFPFLALLVSGGHTQIMQVKALGDYEILGETIDDAAGEAFDKSAQLLGLGYPGGPAISQWAAKGKADRFMFPRPLVKRPTLDFSFAGLKTAVLTQVQKLTREAPLDDSTKADVAAGVQAAIVDVLVAKCSRAIQETGISNLVVAGGVSANQALRQQLAEMQGQLNAKVFFPAPSLCTDNGVMIAWAAGLRLLNGTEPQSAGSFNVRPRWPLG